MSIEKFHTDLTDPAMLLKMLPETAPVLGATIRQGSKPGLYRFDPKEFDAAGLYEWDQLFNAETVRNVRDRWLAKRAQAAEDRKERKRKRKAEQQAERAAAAGSWGTFTEAQTRATLGSDSSEDC